MNTEAFIVLSDTQRKNVVKDDEFLIASLDYSQEPPYDLIAPIIKNFHPYDFPIKIWKNSELNHDYICTSSYEWYYIRKYVKLWQRGDIPRVGHVVDGLVFPISEIPRIVTINYYNNQYNQKFDIKPDELIVKIINEKEYVLWQSDNFIIPLLGLKMSVTTIETIPQIDITNIMMVQGIFSTSSVRRAIASNKLTFPALRNNFIYDRSLGFIPKCNK